MEPRGAAAVLLAAALAAGGCVRAHEPRAGADAAAEAPRTPAGPSAGAHPPAPAAAPAAAPAVAPAAAAVDFASQVQPILAARCQPCHFTGGKIYEKLPFDDPATIHHLGERLFTRIRAADEQAVIRAFLAQEEQGAAPPAVERRK